MIKKEMKATMGQIVNKVKRIALVDSTQRATKNMVDIVKQNLIKYDTVIGQLQNDHITTTRNIMNTIETGTNLNYDTENYIKRYFAERDKNEDRITKYESNVEYMNVLMNSMEFAR